MKAPIAKTPPWIAQTFTNNLERQIYFFVFVINRLDKTNKLELTGETDGDKHSHANE